MDEPSLMQLINRVHRALVRDGDARLKPLGLRYAQIPVVAFLLARGSATQKTLAEASGIEQPSMAQLLVRMDRDGLVRQHPNPDDARSRVVTLTDPGDRRIVDGRARLADLERQATAGLSASELQVLRALLLRVWSNLDDRGPDGS